MVHVAPLAVEAQHGGRDGVRLLDCPFLEEGLKARNAQVAQEGAAGGGDDGEMGVVALVGGEEGGGDGVVGRDGEGGGWVEVFYCCLKPKKSVELISGLKYGNI